MEVQKYSLASSGNNLDTRDGITSPKHMAETCLIYVGHGLAYFKSSSTNTNTKTDYVLDKPTI